MNSNNLFHLFFVKARVLSGPVPTSSSLVFGEKVLQSFFCRGAMGEGEEPGRGKGKGPRSLKVQSKKTQLKSHVNESFFCCKSGQQRGEGNKEESRC